MKDTIYTANTSPSNFQFDGKVASVFDNMIRRSVPGYHEIIKGSIDLCLAQQKASPLTLYDLGCATGETALALLSRLKQQTNFFAIDCSEPMLKKAEMTVGQFKLNQHNIQFIKQDVLETNIEQADVVLLLFTLQFIELNKRNRLLEKIYNGLKPGGLLIVAEKTHHPKPSIQALLESFHLNHKREQGYSELEISQKRQALDNVLLTETVESHLSRLQQCGFNDPFCWYYNRLFAAMACYK